MPFSPALPRFDADKVADILREAAARAVMPRFQRLEEADFVQNGSGDVVTRADLEAEAIIGPRLQALLPGSYVVGEEACKHDPARMDVFGGEAPVWVIDPVDGTRNFAAGSPDFCMMVGLIQGQRTLWSWIYDPPEDSMTMAEAGSGALRDGRRLVIEAGPDKALPPAGNFIGQINRGYFAKPMRMELKAACEATLGASDYLNCVGHDLLRQARGLRHYSFYRRLWCWDHAPPVLILREAGGMATRLDGKPYRAGDRVPGLVCARDGAMHAKLRDALTPWPVAVPT